MRATGLARRLVRLASPLVALGVWQLLTSLDVNLWLRFEQFPTVVEVVSALADRIGTETYWQDLGHSLRRIALGFLLAAVLGVAAGTAVARSRWAADVLGPLVEVVRPVPAIALVPVAILLLPTNEQGIVFITCAAAFFPVLVSTRHAVRALDPAWEEAVLTLGGSRARVLFSVVLPGSLPGVFGGLSVGIGVAWICVISAEMISGEYGVGYRTWQDYTVVDYPGVFVGMATIGVLGRLTSTAVEALGRRVTAWLPSPAEGGATGRARPAPWGRTAPADAERTASPDADRAASPDPGLRVSPDPDRSASPDADRAAEHDGSSAPGSVRTPAAPPVPDKEPVR
ncbi:ABC transporter permease subunit [Streptomyces sp. NPDC014746]|uniref:ABC transporter permease n=1 Tax=Streptomyces sp. NPDC014746 TaxID=3364904 RepID=UPI0036FB42F5